jgi:hypothetical protein
MLGWEKTEPAILKQQQQMCHEPSMMITKKRKYASHFSRLNTVSSAYPCVAYQILEES